MTWQLVKRLQTLALLMASALTFCGYSEAQDNSMDCTAPPKSHVALASGDENTRTELQVNRKISADVPVDLQVCDGDLTIKASRDEFLRITVNFPDNPGSSSLGDYLEGFDVTPQTAIIKLHLPKHPRAKVTIAVPSSAPRLQLNLVRGDLAFETDRIRGDRKINVVSGHVELLANADTYGSFNASVLMGSFHDHRPGGDEAHGIVSKSISGTGKGSIDLNVVRGSVDVKAWD